MDEKEKLTQRIGEGGEEARAGRGAEEEEEDDNEKEGKVGRNTKEF